MLELQRNIYVLRRWWWLLAGAAVLGALVSFALTKALIQQQYKATAIVSMAPPPSGPNGLYVTMLVASADAQLVPTVATAAGAVRSFPGISADSLASHTDSLASPENQLLFISVTWGATGTAEDLANAVAGSFIGQERTRLERRYSIIHQNLLSQERHLTALMQRAPGTGAARSWLQGQYADAVSKIYQQDADARIQATEQQASLSLAQSATKVVKVGPKPTVNAALGGLLALLIALVFALVATSEYGQSEDAAEPRPVLAKVGE
jgi:capsular polysaccharide biosynthesis protein